MTIAGAWFNQHHSVLHLEQDGRVLRGTFRPGVGLAKGEAFEVSGIVSGEQLGFSVAFGPAGAITSWVGHVRRGAPGEGDAVLETLWHMAVRIDPADPDGWRGIWSGADTFRRGEPELALAGPFWPSVPVRLGGHHG